MASLRLLRRGFDDLLQLLVLDVVLTPFGHHIARQIPPKLHACNKEIPLTFASVFWPKIQRYTGGGGGIERRE
jgi:hypothetical protein